MVNAFLIVIPNIADLLTCMRRMQVPLLLHSCSFENLSFHQPAHVNQATVAAAVEALDHHMVRAALYMQLLSKLRKSPIPQCHMTSKTVVLPVTGKQGHRHMNLLQRALEPCLEDRLAKAQTTRTTAGVAHSD